AGSTWAVRPIQSSAADMQVTATPAAGSTFNVRALQSSAADLQATVTQASTVWAVQLTQYSTTVNVSSVAGAVMTRSSAADHMGTVYQSTAGDLKATVTLDGSLQSTSTPSTNSSGLVVRQALPHIFTTASSNAFASTTLAIQSSAANTRMYV